LLRGPFETDGLPSPCVVLPARGGAAKEDEAFGEGGCGVELLRGTGNVKEIVAPRSGLPSAQIWPPWREMSRRTWASPIPVPSKSAARWSRCWCFRRGGNASCSWSAWLDFADSRGSRRASGCHQASRQKGLLYFEATRGTSRPSKSYGGQRQEAIAFAA